MLTSKKIIGVGLFVGMLSFGILYADTIIYRIPGGQVSSSGSSYTSQSIQTISGSGGLIFMNEGENADSVGDYFSGYYYDSAHGMFKMDATPASRVTISSINVLTKCDNSTHTGYKLTGYSYNEDFGYMNFNYDTTRYAYICIPKDSTDTTLSSYLGGYAYSSLIGFQNFNNIQVDNTVDIYDEDASGAFVKVEGNVSTGDGSSIIDGQTTDEVRILGNITKSSLRKDIQQEVYKVVKSAPVRISGSLFLSSSKLNSSSWSDTGLRATSLVNNSVLYFSVGSGENIILEGTDSLSGIKTLVIEGGNVYITGNIRGTGTLGIISLIKKDVSGVNQGGNIYIDPTVTDIHAIMYADKSVISYNGTTELDGSTPASELANQLYIYGSIFSENTLGGSVTNTCPFYVNSCNNNIAKKYDLNYLRKYILVQPVDALGQPLGAKKPQFNASQSYMGDSSNTNTSSQKPGYEKYPVIIEYNPTIQQSNIPFFTKQ